MALALEFSRWLWRGGQGQWDPALWSREFPGGLWMVGSEIVAQLPTLDPLLASKMAEVFWFRSSGSGGVTKWLALPREGVRRSALEVNRWLGAGPEDDWALCLPTHHVGGFSILVRAALSGARVHGLAQRWEAGALLALIRSHGVAFLSLVPTQLHDLVQTGQRAPQSLKSVLVGGAALVPELALQARSLGWPIVETYGMTEACSQVATQRPGASGALEVLPHWQVSLNAEGRLCLAGPSLALGALSLRADGWSWDPLASPWCSEDRVELISCGEVLQLCPLGRAGSGFKVFGELLYLEPLQGRLDGIARRLGFGGKAALVDLPDVRAGRRVWLAIEGEVCPQLREIYDAQSAGIERIAGVIQLPQLPRGELGKITLHSLRKMMIERGALDRGSG